MKKQHEIIDGVGGAQPFRPRSQLGSIPPDAMVEVVSTGLRAFSVEGSEGVPLNRDSKLLIAVRGEGWLRCPTCGAFPIHHHERPVGAHVAAIQGSCGKGHSWVVRLMSCLVIGVDDLGRHLLRPADPHTFAVLEDFDGIPVSDAGGIPKAAAMEAVATIEFFRLSESDRVSGTVGRKGDVAYGC